MWAAARGKSLARSRVVLGALASAVMVTGTLALAVPAQAESDTYSGWSHREDGRSPGTDTIDSMPGSSLHLYSFDNQVSISSDASVDDPGLGIEFLPPAGQTLQTGATYSVGGALRRPTSTMGQVIAHRHDAMCGRTEDELSSDDDFPTTPAVGWFHVDNIEYVDGAAVSFAATYEVNCQYLDGPAGFEGSIAVNAPLPPSPVPDAPAPPGPITNLKATNTGPDSGGTNTTTLTWTDPADYGDVNIDMVQSADTSLFPAVVADYFTQQWRGRASSYSDGDVEFMDVRTYRVVARGPSGRLGTPSLLTIMGSRLNIPVRNQTITIGQQVPFSGRLTKALGVEQPDADPMSGAPLPRRTVVMCEQPSAHFVNDGCNRVDSTTTSADGRFTLAATPMANSYYSVMLPSSPDLVGNRSYVLFTGVAPQTDLRAPSGQSLGAGIVKVASATARVRRGSVIHFTTSRARRGSLGIVRLQHISGGRWHTIATKRLGRGTHRLGLSFRAHTRGLHSFRVVKPADPHHVNGYSHTVKIRVS